MPSKKEYDLVSDDGYDSRIPLHNDDAFQHGIHFQAKYIGTLDVPRPSSRVEIVAAMRRIRYEFKAKAIKKKKVELAISVEGVKVSSCKKKKKLPQWYDEKKLIIVQHPIYRIFYVSHDSQDLKIWSYIARDGPSNVFKCNVFKSYKKEQAMRIVRTIGQAFEVCHKLSIAPSLSVPEEQTHVDSEGSPAPDSDKQSAKSKDFEETLMKKESSSPLKSRAVTPPTELSLRQAQHMLYQMAATSPQQIGGTTITSPMSNSPGLLEDDLLDPDLPVTSRHHVQLLQQQVEHQQQQTQVAVAQVQLLKDQLAAETAARIESQARAHQLLLQNRDLLDHMHQILKKLHDLEVNSNKVGDRQSQLMITQGVSMPDATTPQCGPVYLPRCMTQDADGNSMISPDMCMIEDSKTQFDTDSPDSGHREMSSDNLTLSLPQGDPRYWEASEDERLKYSFGFSSPVKFRQMSYEMTAVVNSNPFANGGDGYSDQDVLDFSNFEEKLKVLAPTSQPGKSADKKLELKLEVAPKLRPPPEFRTCGLRDSQASDDSSNSSNSDGDSLKDGIVNFTDSDYYSHTGSSSQTNYASGSNSQFVDNRDVRHAALVYRPKLEYHYNNFAEEVSQMYYTDDTSGKRQSYSDEESSKTYDEFAPPPSPPPPPSRLEELVDD